MSLTFLQISYEAQAKEYGERFGNDDGVYQLPKDPDSVIIIMSITLSTIFFNLFIRLV